VKINRPKVHKTCENFLDTLFSTDFSNCLSPCYRRSDLTYFDIDIHVCASVQLVRRFVAGYNTAVGEMGKVRLESLTYVIGPAENVSDRKTTYLLPCSACGREIPVEPQQAGEAVRCQCGQTCMVPTMREVQSLRPASASTPAPAQPAWGNPQRFLVAGSVVFLLAAIAATILYRQLPPRLGGLPPSPDAARQYVKGLSPLQTLDFFHRQILPGIEIHEQADVQRKRNMVYLGLGAIATVGAIGLILVATGVAGIVRRRR
jgi:DNA-directed RNA polymerase subunit RPC12/RpoP